jgi:hypothetical protein
MSFHKEHIIKLSNSEEEYKLTIKLEENDDFIQFHLKNTHISTREYYFLKMNLEEFVSLNRYFLMFEKIEELANNISNIIRDCVPKLIKEQNGMSLIFNIFIPGQDKREIKLFLEEKPFETLSVIDELKNEINKLKVKINDLEISVNRKDALYEALKCKYDELKDNFDTRMEQFETELINIKSQLPQQNYMNNNINQNPNLRSSQEVLEQNKNESSTIINNNLELNLLSNKIRQLYPGKNVIYNLLYRKSRDTDKAKVFHSKCDKIKGTLIIIKTSRGYKIGGYTNETWEGNNAYKFDNTAFLFSLNYNKIYDVKINKFAIYCSPFFGPIFCGDKAPTLLVHDNAEIKGGECCGANDSNYQGYLDDYEINGGQKNFRITELEVFKVTLN